MTVYSALVFIFIAYLFFFNLFHYTDDKIEFLSPVFLFYLSHNRKKEGDFQFSHLYNSSRNGFAR